MAKAIAKITGTALRPGVSKNGRLYTKAHITSAVARANARLAEGSRPMTMLTHHLAGDDSTRIAGRVAHWTVGDEGEARYEAYLAATDAGRTMAALVDDADGEPFLRNVSIRGGWLGRITRKVVDGQTVEAGEDLELDGLDFTKSPGVTGADIDSFAYLGDAANESTDRAVIFETADAAAVVFTETMPEAEVPDIPVEEKATALKSGKAATPQTKANSYADPGYQPDKMKRYALDTKSQAKAAWSYINQKDNAKNYTAQQLKRIKDRIKAALAKFGVKTTAEGYLLSPAVQVTESTALEHYDVWPDEPGSFSVSISNGTVNICISSYRIDPADLEVCARAAMDGACQALAAMDPDDDGDIDTDGSNAEAEEPEDAITEDGTEGNAPMADQPTTPAAETPQPSDAGTQAAQSATAPAVTGGFNITLTDTQFAALMAQMNPAAQLVGAGAPAESAPAPAPAPAAPAATVPAVVEQAPPASAAPAPTASAAPAPTAPAVVEQAPTAGLPSTPAELSAIVAAAVAAALPGAVQEAAQGGALPARKGHVAGVAETAAATDEFPAAWPRGEDGTPLEAHKLTNEQWARVNAEVLPAAIGNHLRNR